MLAEKRGDPQVRLRKSERHDRILQELRLRPHVGIAELSERFGVSSETIRRDFELLSDEGLVSRSHGGATLPPHRQYPGFDERNRARIEERERIGRAAARLVADGDTIMVDAGSTTLQFARFLAYQGTACTVVTNSLNVATTLGQSDRTEIVLCPGDFLASESAVVGPDTIEFLGRHRVGACFLGASCVTGDGVSELVRGFAAVKRAMLEQSAKAHLLVDGSKFGGPGLVQVGRLEDVTSIVTDRPPQDTYTTALEEAGVRIIVASE